MTSAIASSSPTKNSASVRKIHPIARVPDTGLLLVALVPFSEDYFLTIVGEVSLPLKWGYSFLVKQTATCTAFTGSYKHTLYRWFRTDTTLEYCAGPYETKVHILAPPFLLGTLHEMCASKQQSTPHADLHSKAAGAENSVTMLRTFWWVCVGPDQLQSRAVCERTQQSVFAAFPEAHLPLCFHPTESICTLWDCSTTQIKEHRSEYVSSTLLTKTNRQTRWEVPGSKQSFHQTEGHFRWSVSNSF